MGTYFGVTCVEKNGNQIVQTLDYQPPIPTGNRLVAVMDNGVWRIAPDVTDKKEFDSFYRDYSSGNWLRMTLYLVLEEKVKKCPDEGRVHNM